MKERVHGVGRTGMYPTKCCQRRDYRLMMQTLVGTRGRGMLASP